MEQEQILKQLEWLDEERRKDKDLIARQQDRLLALEGNLEAVHKQLRELSSEVTRLSALVVRMNQFDESLLQQRTEFNQKLEEMDKQGKKREEESEKVRRVEMRAIDTNLAEIRKELEAIEGLKRALGARVEEDQRLSRAIDELRTKIQDMRRAEEEFNRTYRLIEDGRRQDSKRLVDLQGEVATLRKLVDEQRGRMELLSTNLRKYENRINELVASEAERREEQIAFLDKQALIQVERDRTWKEWQTRFETIEKQSTDLESQLQSLETTYLAVKRAQEALEELSERVERRMNEITEMQRLTEDRFRQEWTTFKADDQKRWANYTLVQEEQRNEFKRQMEKLTERVTHLEDSLQELQDVLYIMNEHSEKQLQSLLALVHDWAEAYERAFSHLR